MKDLFGKEQDLSILLDDGLKKQWKMYGYDIEYKDYPECLNVLEFSKCEEKYIQFIVSKECEVYVNTYEQSSEWQQLSQYEIYLVKKTIDFIRGELQ